MQLAKIEFISDGGPWCEHNMPCPIYGDQHAVYDMNTGIFLPCREAQRNGYVIAKADTRFGRWVLRTFFSI